MQEILMPTGPAAPDDTGALRTDSADSWGQDLGPPAQSDPAETTDTGAGAAGCPTEEVNGPGYLPPDHADVLTEPDYGEPDGTGGGLGEKGPSRQDPRSQG